METIDAFKARADAHAGVRFESLPDVPAEALLEGQILCQRDGCFVVTRGYPVEDPETGAQVYGAFGVVDRARLREPADVATPQIGSVVAMGGAVGGAAVVVDHAPDGTARLVYEREDGALLAGDAARGWDRADEDEVARYSAAEPWNA